MGYEKPRLIESQIASYVIDQEHFNAGQKPLNRIDLIRFEEIEYLSTTDSDSTSTLDTRDKTETEPKQQLKTLKSILNVQSEAAGGHGNEAVEHLAGYEGSDADGVYCVSPGKFTLSFCLIGFTE
jgi:hypothetical protein